MHKGARPIADDNAFSELLSPDKLNCVVFMFVLPLKNFRWMGWATVAKSGTAVDPSVAQCRCRATPRQRTRPLLQNIPTWKIAVRGLGREVEKFPPTPWRPQSVIHVGILCSGVQSNRNIFRNILFPTTLPSKYLRKNLQKNLRLKNLHKNLRCEKSS